MRNLIFAAILISFQACQTPTESSADTKTTNWGGYELENVEGTDYKIALKKGDGGEILERGIIRNFMRNGAWMTYHQGEDTGKIKTLVTYMDDQYNGVYLELSDRGQLKLEATYANNKLNGRWAKYHAGWLKEEANYKNGQLDGVYKAYYDGSKQLLKEAEYKNGVQEGFYKQYGEDGKLLLEYVFKGGQKIDGGMTQ